MRNLFAAATGVFTIFACIECQAQQSSDNYPLATPNGSNPSLYVVPTLNGNQPGFQAGGSYTTQSGTQIQGTVSTTQGGDTQGTATVTIPCGSLCGN